MTTCLFLLPSPLRFPLPANPDQLFPLSPAYNREPSLTLNLCFCITGLVCFFSLSLLGPLLSLSAFSCSGNSASQASQWLAISAFLHNLNSSNTTANKQHCQKEGGWAGGTVQSTTVPFKTVAMETPLSSPLICVYIAGFD